MPERIPRHLGGTDSIASDAPMPHSPPIPIPYSARMTKKKVRWGENPQASSTTEKKTTLTIKGMRRPYRSVSSPKMSAPTGRIASVTRRDATTAFLLTGKLEASLSKRKTTTKKSNASSVHPKNDAVTACAWPDPESPGTPLSRPLLINDPSHRSSTYALCYVAVEQARANSGQSQ